jgi:hypothetical protein
MNMKTRKSFKWALLATTVALLAACGGGGNGTTATTATDPGTTPFTITGGLGVVDPSTLSTFSIDSTTPVTFTSKDAGIDGTAGEGGPINNGTVIITDASATPQTLRVKTNAKGYYFAKVTGFTAPLVVKIVSQSGKVHYSLLDSPISAGSINTVNITPLTDKVASLVMGTASVATITPGDITPAKVASAKSAVKAIFANALSAVGITSGKTSFSSKLDALYAAATTGTAISFNPITTPFVANGTGYDKLLDQIRHETNADGTTDLFAKTISYAADGTVASTPLSSTQLLVLTSGTELNFARLDSLRSQLTACFAQAEAARDYNTAGNACAGLAHPSFKSAGRDFAETVVQMSGRKDRNRVLEAADVMTGASFDAPELLLLENAAGTGTDLDKAVIELRWYQPANQSYRTSAFTMRRFDGFTAAGAQRSAIANADGTSSDWWIYGGQSDYSYGITPRMQRYTNLNVATNVVTGTVTAPASPSMDYSGLGLFVGTQKFNTTTRAWEDSGVAYAKVTGPGLPASGVVLSRIASSAANGLCIAPDDVAYDATSAPINSEATYLGYYSSTGLMPGPKLNTFVYSTSTSPFNAYSAYNPGSPGIPGMIPPTPPSGDDPNVSIGTSRTLLGNAYGPYGTRGSITTTIALLIGGATYTTTVQTSGYTDPMLQRPTPYSIPFAQTTGSFGVSYFQGTITYAGGDTGTTTVTYPLLTGSTTNRFNLGRALPSGVDQAFSTTTSVYGVNNAAAPIDYSLIKPWSRYTIALYNATGVLLSTETDRIVAQLRPPQSLQTTPMHDLSPSHAALTPSQAASPTLDVQWTNNSAAPTPYQAGLFSSFYDAATTATTGTVRRSSSSHLKRQQLSTSGPTAKTFAAADLGSFTGCRVPTGNTSVVEKLDSGRTLNTSNSTTAVTFRSVFLNTYVNRVRITQTTEWAN